MLTSAFAWVVLVGLTFAPFPPEHQYNFLNPVIDPWWAVTKKRPSGTRGFTRRFFTQSLSHVWAESLLSESNLSKKGDQKPNERIQILLLIIFLIKWTLLVIDSDCGRFSKKWYPKQTSFGYRIFINCSNLRKVIHTKLDFHWAQIAFNFLEENYAICFPFCRTLLDSETSIWSPQQRNHHDRMQRANEKQRWK